MKIYLVDDLPDQRESLAMLLRQKGHTVQEFGSGHEVVDACQRSLPDVVLIDLMMPQMDGFETARAVWKVGHLPIIALTARDEEDLVRRAGETVPIQSFLKKLEDLDVLETQIRFAVSRFPTIEANRRRNQAQGILMQRYRLPDERAAHSRLIREARKRRITTDQMVDEILRPPVAL